MGKRHKRSRYLLYSFLWILKRMSCCLIKIPTIEFRLIEKWAQRLIRGTYSLYTYRCSTLRQSLAVNVNYRFLQFPLSLPLSLFLYLSVSLSFSVIPLISWSATLDLADTHNCTQEVICWCYIFKCKQIVYDPKRYSCNK